MARKGHRISRTRRRGAGQAVAVGAWLALAGCASAPPGIPSAVPSVSPAEESRAAALFQDRAGRFRQTAEERLRAVVARLLAAMDLARHVPFRILDANDANAYARDGAVHVTLGMMRFVQNDDELALVVGHELGHMLADQQAEAARFSPEDRERVADYHGLVALHRTGYDIVAACEVWKRMATELVRDPAGEELPGQVRWMTTHPSFAERYVRAHKVAEALLSGGVALPPPARPTDPPATPAPRPTGRAS